MKTLKCLIVAAMFPLFSMAQLVEFNQAIVDDNRADIIRYGEALIAKGSPSPELLRRVAIAYKESNQLNKSIGYLEQAYSIDSNSIKVTQALGEYYLTTGNDEKALDYLNRVSALDPSNTYSLNLIQKIHFSRGNLTSALATTLKLCAIDSNSYTSYRNLGIILQRLDQKEGAEQAYQKALTLNPNDYTSRLKLCNMLIIAGRNQEATAQATAGLALLPNKKSQIALNLQRNLALIRYNTRDADTCIQITKELQANGDTTEAFTFKLLGYCYFMKGFYDQATENLEKLYKLSPDGDSLSFFLPYTIAQSCYNMYYKGKGTFYAEKAITNISPDSTSLYNGYIIAGKCNLQQQRKEKAILLFEKAIEINPSDIEAYRELAGCYSTEGSKASQLKIISRYLRYIEGLKAAKQKISKEIEKQYLDTKKWYEREKS